MATLIQKAADGAIVNHWEIGAQAVTFGRGRKADRQVGDSQLSRVHFAILFQNGRHMVEDRASTNGTFVNGVRVSTAALRPFDRITAGQSVFVYEEGLQTVLSRMESAGRHYDTFVAELRRR
jgi:pSer/pThr/pTyr-binding forkhead associated (FHA) protein